MNSNLEPHGRVALFLHWSKNNKINMADERYISELEKFFDFVLVVRNLNGQSSNVTLIEKVKTNRFELHRPNHGYDFGGYQAGVQYLSEFREEIKEILICNNSVVLISDSLAQTIDSMRSLDPVITAATSSNEFAHHLQSYFVHFSREVVQDIRFWEYWSEIQPVEDKLLTVKNLEVGLTSYFKGLGFECSAIWSFDRMVQFAQSPAGFSLYSHNSQRTRWQKMYKKINTGKSLNITHEMWLQLLELGFPFVKKDLRKLIGASDPVFPEWKRFCHSKDHISEVTRSFNR